MQFRITYPEFLYYYHKPIPFIIFESDKVKMIVCQVWYRRQAGKSYRENVKWMELAITDSK